MGIRFREKYILSTLILISFVCFALLLFLPSSDDIISRSVIARGNRWRTISRDQYLLKRKINLTNIPIVDMYEELKEKIDSIDESNIVYRRNFIVQMTKFAWMNYKKFAWSQNELRPISKTGHSSSIFGSGKTGATIIDATDTLYIMGLSEEYKEAREWIQNEYDMKNAGGDISVFETNIRFLGGMLAAYALTEDEMYKRKAVEIADLLLPSFDSPTGIPYSVLNTISGTARNWGWASSGCSILSEFGSMQLEFDYLSRITNNSIYSNKISRLRNVISSIEKPEGLYPNYLNPKTGKWGQRHVSVGALGDSFYEYLLKTWLLSNKVDVEAKKLYDDAMFAIKKHLLKYSEQNHLAYFAEMKGSRIEHKMDHLACFIAGLFALEAMNEIDNEKRANITELAEQIGNTCHESYIRTTTRLGPESFRFTRDAEAIALKETEKYYILRPEVIEGWFYLWRLTHNETYREWSWNAAKAIEKHCRTDNGYSGIRDVYSSEVSLDDVQQSFALAETFKYLFLTFSDDSVLSLDKWVFNTEAHPLPVA